VITTLYRNRVGKGYEKRSCTSFSSRYEEQGSRYEALRIAQD